MANMKHYILTLLLYIATALTAFPDHPWGTAMTATQHLLKRASNKRPASRSSESPPRNQRPRNDSPSPRQQSTGNQTPPQDRVRQRSPFATGLDRPIAAEASVTGPALVSVRERSTTARVVETIHDVGAGETETFLHTQGSGGRMKVQNLGSAASAVVQTQGRRVRSDVTPRTNAGKTDIQLDESSIGNAQMKLRKIHAASSARVTAHEPNHPVKVITTLLGRGKISTKARSSSPGRSSQSSGFSDSGSEPSPSPSQSLASNPEE